MPTLPIYQVDAFSDRPFAGNPAAVCPLAGPIPEALMQDIAAENNLSETAFFCPQGNDVFGLRWFTPTVEVDLCGHATLASAFVLMTELEPGRTQVTFRTRSGLLPVRRNEGGEIVLDFPAWPPVLADAETRAKVSEALGGEPAAVLATPSGTWLALLGSANAVRQATPDLVALARFGASLCITAPGDGESRPVDFVSRYFAPAHGIPEDPVTGSAHCFLAPYWGARLGKAALRARQVSRRGGEISCAIVGDRVHISGRARLVITGTLSY